MKILKHQIQVLYMVFQKLASEKLIKELFYNTKLKYLINRFGVISGPSIWWQDQDLFLYG